MEKLSLLLNLRFDKAICVNSGVNPKFINIGTNTGAKIAHLAEADPMKMLMNATTKINKITNGIPCNPIAFNNQHLEPHDCS